MLIFLTFNCRRYYQGEGIGTMMPLSEEQRCLMDFGEWEQYCSNIREDIPRANHLLSWEYLAPGCQMRPFDPEVVVKSMIEEGGWSLIGDSLTRSVWSLKPSLLILACFCIILSTKSALEASRRLRIRALPTVS